MEQVTGALMDEITARASELEITCPYIRDYSDSLDEIVSYIHRIRIEPLSNAEIDVTKFFTGPLPVAACW